ncbi:hypothetical protein GCM10009779_38480 [Polymorphospora rubra]|uniref:Uncharacterized protein n=1 Tax=Polymorphospora rubra TaxID=338584 RepID=A0A810N927_9ACTN|nr:hypothetical protein Prubr_65710 [Polymorphospora rubra]
MSLFGTPVAIRVFTALKAGQPIQSIGLASKQGKKGTPTMDGVVFIVATVFAYVAGDLDEAPFVPVIALEAIHVHGQ